MRTNRIPNGSLLVILLAALSLSGGCASGPPDLRPIAECPVCKCNGDLGCLIVHIDDRTPRSEFGGHTFYFCSPECKAAFDKSAARYAKH